MNIYGVRLIWREFHCRAHGNRCHWHFLNTFLSSSLYLSLRLFLGPSFFLASTRWRDAPFQTPFARRSQSHVIQPGISRLSPSISSPRSLFLSVLPPPTKADKGLSFLPGLPALCVFVLYQTGVPLSLYSFLFLQKKVSRAPGAPASGLGGRASAVRERVYYFI